MECPYCHETLPFIPCSSCGTKISPGSRYCNQCGTQIKGIPEQKEGKGEDDFSNRKLCSDGTCVGIINERGVCNICGKPYTGEPS